MIVVCREDPFVSAQYAKHFVSAFQAGDDPRYLKASSCCKHYTAYDLEDWNGTDRHHFNAIVTDQDLVDTFQVSFQSCVQQAHVSSIMCSYNEVNGIPSCANEFFNTEVLRNEWGFQGYITSDCGAVSDVYYAHHYTNTTDATCAVTLKSGMDIGCDGFLPQYLQQAINDGAVVEADLDRALFNLFLVRFRCVHTHGVCSFSFVLVLYLYVVFMQLGSL
jgi:beta-glucosidase-like glycosyl hydrolase